jgi:hypothetical protein
LQKGYREPIPDGAMIATQEINCSIEIQKFAHFMVSCYLNVSTACATFRIASQGLFTLYLLAGDAAMPSKPMHMKIRLD